MPPRLLPLASGAALALLAAAPAAAQVIRFPARRAPSAWVSLSAGVLQFGDAVDDGRTNSRWEFATAPQLRASLERDAGNGTSYGLVATYARPTLQWTGPVDDVVNDQRRGEGTVSSLAALFRAGGGRGLHQVIEVGLGVRRYSGFETDGGAALPPADGDVDFTGTLGFGFGYPLGDRAAVSLVQDADFTFHQRDRGTVTDYDGGIHRTYVTRLGIRFGFGTARRGR